LCILKIVENKWKDTLSAATKILARSATANAMHEQGGANPKMYFMGTRR
jgi:hypothetical protein